MVPRRSRGPAERVSPAIHTAQARQALPVAGTVGRAAHVVLVHELARVVDVSEPDDVCEFVVDDRLRTVSVVRVVDVERGEEVAEAEQWAAGISGPAYAIDDETAITVVDGTVEVVSEGQWKLLSP
jgi:hypothetical protein